jgi:hypothetical protein
MKISLRTAAATMAAFGALAVAPALALAPVTVTAKDPSPSMVTRPTLIGRTQVVKLRENAQTPNTVVRFKVYPETYGYRATSSACQGTFHTHWVKTASNGKVTIRMNHPKPLCAGVLYQAQARIGEGEVPDKFAHLCVRGRTPDATSCQDSL